jgi:signal transduction histidine kinase
LKGAKSWRLNSSNGEPEQETAGVVGSQNGAPAVRRPLSRASYYRPPRAFIRNFGGLKVRYKLVVLHNLFFFVLAASVYLSVIPVFSQRIAAARQRELHMMSQIFAAELPLSSGEESSELAIYDFRRGAPSTLGLSQAGQVFLEQHPSDTWQQGGDTLFRAGKSPGIYRRVRLSPAFYSQAVRQAKITLFTVLGSIYVVSIIVMEFLIMPQFVYRPLRLMLAADEATQHDDRQNELINDQFILNDEIGQIMRSRNASISQLRHQEEVLATALNKLEEQDRLVSLGLLSTSVAHELNTPLAVLLGSIEKLQETTQNPQTLDRLARMQRVAQRMAKISEGLVDFARVRKHETEPVSLRPLIEESWNLVAIDEKAAVVTFNNNVPETHVVRGNSDRLVQVFVNLLRNALLAVSTGGEITVQSRNCHRSGHSMIACAVLDNGPGISAEVLPNLFEAFVSTRLDARGTGLGLTVAEGIVTQHGGTISAANRPEGGAALEVVLPAA